MQDQAAATEKTVDPRVGSDHPMTGKIIEIAESLQKEVEGRGVFVQALVPGATATDFWASTGVDIKSMPANIVMTSEDFVRAALRGLDNQEPICIPGLPDVASWEAYKAARGTLGQAIMANSPAPRYLT